MRTSPILQSFWSLVAAVLLAIPLFMLTRPSTPAQSDPMTTFQPTPANHTPCLVTIKCSTLPESLTIKNEGNIVFDMADYGPVAQEMDEDINLPVRAGQQLTLTVQAKWAKEEASNPDSAVTIAVEPDGRQERQQTRWSHGANLNDTYSFRW